MKIRTGFVSNSSTTSFCIYGLKIRMDYLDITIPPYERVKDFDLSYYEDPDNDEIYIGMPFTKMGLNETRKDFQDEVESKIRRFIEPNLIDKTVQLDFDIWDEMIYN